MSKENPSGLEKLLLEGVENNTPASVKEDKIFDYKNKEKFTFTLTKDIVDKLELKKWFESYKKRGNGIYRRYQRTPECTVSA